jgi:hypothetical protein
MMQSSAKHQQMPMSESTDESGGDDRSAGALPGTPSRMNKQVDQKEDGRFIVYYSFQTNEADESGK